MSNGDLVSPYAEEPQPQTNAEPQAASGARVVSRAVYGLLAVLTLGAAGVYGAVTVRPELAEYVSFLPGMKSDVPACGARLSSGCGSASSCSAASTCPSACSAISRATAAVAETCPMMEEQRQAIVLSDAVFAEPAAEQASEPAASENAEPAAPVQTESAEPTT